MFKRFFNKHRHGATLVSNDTLGAPVWTPRNYHSLAQEGYLQNVIVYRCINLIAKGLSSIPWVIYEGQEELNKHPIIDLINQPNPKSSRRTFIENLVGYLLLAGNSYVEANYDDEGRAVELYTVRPDHMKVIPGAGGVPKAFIHELDGRERRFIVNQLTGNSAILHLKNFHPLNQWYGMSPIEAAATAIDQHNAVSSHNLAVMQNGGRPSGAFVINKPDHGVGLSEEQLHSIRNDLRNTYSGEKNAGKILLIEGDCRWQEMGLSPKDLDFINGKAVSSREIAQAFGVPPMLVGVTGDATFANFREARYHLWEDTILPLLDNIIAEMNRWLCEGYGHDLRISYDRDEIPALTLKREAVWERVQKSEFLTINEKREAVGYSPLPEGDQLVSPRQAEQQVERSGP